VEILTQSSWKFLRAH